MSTTMKAAVHLGQNNNEILVTTGNPNFEELKTLFNIILNFEVLNASTIEWTFFL